MGSNINAIIAQGAPLDTPTPQQRMAQTLTLRSAMQGQQLQQQQIQAAQQENQMRAIQMDQTRSLNDAYKAAMTIGADGTPTIDRQQLTTTLARGGHGSAIPGILKQLDEIDKAHVDLQEAKGKVEVQERDAGGAIGAMARAAKYDPGVLMMGLSDAVRRGAVPGQHVAPLIKQLQDAQAQDAQNPGSKAAQTLTQQIADHLITLSPKQQELDNAAKTADARAQTSQTAADKFAVEKPGLAADSATKVAVGDATLKDPNLLNPGQRQQATQATATLDETKLRDAQTARYQNAELNNASQNIALRRQANEVERVKADPYGALGLNQQTQPGFAQNLHGADFLGTLPPGLQNRVKAIAEGRETMTARDKAGAQGQFLDAAVQQYDPTWSEQRAQLRKAFLGAGKQGDNIGNLNTAVVHGDQLLDAAAAMRNHSFVPGNAIYNQIATTFGANAVTNFEALKTAWAGEVATALKGTATDQEIEHISKVIMAKNSMDQLTGAVKTYIPVLGAKLNTYDERFHAQNADDPWSPVLPSARAVFQKNGMQPIERLKPSAQGAPRKNPFRQ